MPSNLKHQILEILRARFGQVRKLEGSQSLFEVGDGALTVYFRYSTVHDTERTFFGLRREDLRRLEGRPAVLCFLWDGQVAPLFVPYSEFEDVFASVAPASDGQYKVQIYLREPSTELYIARAGRFGVDGYFGWEHVDEIVRMRGEHLMPQLTHSQVQSILGAIGTRKNCDVWIPIADRQKVDSSLAQSIAWCAELAPCFAPIRDIMVEVDVIWIERRSGQPRAMFEVEHSTPIYSGLLRFNDIHLTSRNLATTFSVVSNESRRSLFSRQVQRPTFLTTGLSELCTFMRYEDVYSWYRRVCALAANGVTR